MKKTLSTIFQEYIHHIFPKYSRMSGILDCISASGQVIMNVSKPPELSILSLFAALSPVSTSARHSTSQYGITEWSISSITAATVKI